MLTQKASPGGDLAMSILTRKASPGGDLAMSMLTQRASPGGDETWHETYFVKLLCAVCAVAVCSCCVQLLCAVAVCSCCGQLLCSCGCARKVACGLFPNSDLYFCSQIQIFTFTPFHNLNW